MKTHIFTLLLLSLLSTEITAQSTYQKFIRANGILQSGNIKKTADSGFIVTGNYRIRERVSPQYMIIARLDKRARMEWLRAFGDSIRSFGSQLVTTCNDGGYAITGAAFEGGSYFMYVVKFNFTGDLTWAKKMTYAIQGTSSIYPNDIAETKEGTILITGETNGSNLGDEFVLSIKTSNGHVNWLKTIGTVNYKEAGFSIHLTDDHGFIVGGITVPNESNFLIVKYNNNGTMKWTKTIKSKIVSNDLLYSIISTLDNGYAFTGIASGDNNNYNIIAVKLNNRHNVEWSKRMHNATYDAGHGIIQDRHDSSYFIAGGKDIPGLNAARGYLIHLNKHGKLISSSVTTGPGEYAYYTSLIRNKQNIVAAGSSHNRIFITKYDGSGNSCNDIDAGDTSLENFVVDTISVEYSSNDITTDIESEDLPLNEITIDSRVRAICTSNDNLTADAGKNENIKRVQTSFDLKVYPNPVTGNTLLVTVAANKICNMKFSVFNAEGKTVIVRSSFISTGSSVHSFDISTLQKGVYFLEASNNAEKILIKFIRG